MSDSPPGPPADIPPPEPPADIPAPAPEPVAAEATAGETQAPPSYFAPPSGQPPAPAPRRGAGRLVAIIAVVAILIVAVLGYGVGGYLYAGSKLNSAQDAYNGVVAHQNSMNDTFNSLNGAFTGSDVTTQSSSSLAQEKSSIQALATKSQAAQSQIATDDQTLENADSSLDQNSWLTLLRKPDIDKEHTRIGHLRSALADAKTITADLSQDSTFLLALYEVVTDLDDVGNKANAKDLTGANAAALKLAADADKAIALDKAPGMPPAMDVLLQALKSLANDFVALFKAANAGDSNAASSAEKALEADVAKLQTIDSTKVDSDIEAFYKPLRDAYNSEIDKANST